MQDPFQLERFVAAQAEVYERAREELRQGRKRSHWMWYIFPQMRGLGFSAASQFYGLTGLAEAQAYLAHPVLGPRLIEVTRLMLAHQGANLTAILGSPDDAKFMSSMTLFSRVAGVDSVFQRALDVFCGGMADERTLALLTE